MLRVLDRRDIGEHFALEVKGDSMIDAGILDGDIALIKRTEGADTGDIVLHQPPGYPFVAGNVVILRENRR